MSYQKVVTIAYEEGGRNSTAVYSLEKVGGKLTLRKAFARFADEQSCMIYFEQVRWGETIKCPHCGSDRTYRFSSDIEYDE